MVGKIEETSRHREHVVCLLYIGVRIQRIRQAEKRLECCHELCKV